MAQSGLYRGFSSQVFDLNKSFSVYDVELVKIDLLNHIYTRKGERVMMPNFGTIIPDLVFEPLDEETIDTLHDELMRVFDYDPRVEVINLTVTPLPDYNTVMASATLRYIELNIVDQMDINIEFREAF